jgi:hypothetical protein
MHIEYVELIQWELKVINQPFRFVDLVYCYYIVLLRYIAQMRFA